MTTERNVKQLPLRLPEDDYQALKAYAFFTGKSMNGLVTQAVQEYLAGPGRREQFEAMMKKARADYRVTLDKLKEL